MYRVRVEIAGSGVEIARPIIFRVPSDRAPLVTRQPSILDSAFLASRMTV